MNYIDSFSTTAQELIRRSQEGGSLLIDVRHLVLSVLGENVLIQVEGQPGTGIEIPLDKMRLVFRDTNEFPRVPRTERHSHQTR